jgi:hypothetical protein
LVAAVRRVAQRLRRHGELLEGLDAGREAGAVAQPDPLHHAAKLVDEAADAVLRSARVPAG